MAMQQPMAGGIASVLGKPPGNPGAQAQPMVPQIGNQPGGVPMGIGSVDARAAEFMNKPQELQKRYGMTQDTFDLMALMKIKKEKEMAARQMQLQMSQQQAAAGQPPATVKDRLEQEVHELTKNELAEQAGDTLKQQFETKQANLQRIAQGALPPSMAGIAAAPGAQSAAQPKAMAAGGIVAFAGDDPAVGSVVPQAMEENPDFDKDGNPRSREERDAIIAQNERLRLLKSKPILVGQTQDDRVMSHGPAAGIERQQQFYKPRRPDAGAPVTTVSPGAAPDSLTGPTAEGVRKHQVGSAGVTPAVPAPAGLPAAPGASRVGMSATRVGPSGAPTMPGGGINEALRKIQMEEAARNPQKEREAEETRIGEKLNTREEEAQRRKYIDEQRRLMAEEFDPERQREEKLIRFLIGAGGRAYGELGAGAAAGLGYEASQRAAKLKRMEDLQTKEEGIQSLRRGALEKSVVAGQDVYKGASEGKRTGISAATESERTDITSRDKALDREVERLKVQAQMAHTAAIKEGNDFAKLQGALNTAINNRDQATNRVLKAYKDRLDTVDMQLQAKPNDPTLTKQRKLLEAEIEAKIDEARKPFDTLESQIQQHLYGSGKGGSGVIPGAKVERIK